MTVVIPDLVKAIADEKAKKIKRYPCHVNRASNLGYAVPELGGCIRKGVYERTNWQDKELHDVGLQFIFDEGNHQERQVLKDVLDSGYEIIEAQSSYSWEQYQISGHIDGKIMCKTETGENIAVPVEIKSMHPQIFSTIHQFEDFKIKPWHRAYMAQITLYMLMQNIDVAIFILKDKSSGKLKQIRVGLDYELGEACLRTAEIINEHVAKKTLPDRITDIDVCSKCSYKLLCHPDRNFGVELKIADDPSFEAKIDRYFEVEDAKSEAKKLWDNITDKCKATSKNDKGELAELNVLLGKYHIKGKVSSNGSFRTTISTIGSEDE